MSRDIKNILIITTTFYPDPAVAAVRMTQLAKHLGEQGHRIDVMCRYYGFFVDNKDLVQNIGSNISVEYLDAPDSIQHAKEKRKLPFEEKIRPLELIKQHLTRIKKWIANNQKLLGLYQNVDPFVPNISMIFWRRFGKRVRTKIKKSNYDAIITSSPQHAVHHVGMAIKETFPDVKWIADFRDPYLMDKRYAPHGLRKIFYPRHKLFEKNIYTHADLILHAIPEHAEWASVKYPWAFLKIRKLTNGVPEAIIENQAEPLRFNDSSFSIRTVGQIGEKEALLLAESVNELIRSGTDAELVLVGKKPGNTAKIKELLGPKAVLTGMVKHETALQVIRGADLLVSALSLERSRCYLLSSKLFEYLATGKPVLCINPTVSDKNFIKDFARIRYIENPDNKVLAETIRKLIENPPVNDPEKHEQFLSAYSRSSQAAELAEWIDELF